MLGRGHDSLTCITKWDANGSPLWAKEFPIPVNQDFWGMVATTDGGVVIASGFGLQLFVSDILQGIDSIHAKYVVTKLDASGQSVWSRTIAIKEEDTPSDWLWFPQLVPCTDGGFILCVYARATVTSPFQRIIRMTADGYPIWSKEFRFSDLEQAGPIIHMSSDGADGCYIAGFVEVYSNRGFTAHIGSNGTLSWALKLGYTNPQQTLSCHDACSCANGDALVVGQMYNTISQYSLGQSACSFSASLHRGDRSVAPATQRLPRLVLQKK